MSGIKSDGTQHMKLQAQSSAFKSLLGRKDARDQLKQQLDLDGAASASSPPLDGADNWILYSQALAHGKLGIDRSAAPEVDAAHVALVISGLGLFSSEALGRAPETPGCGGVGCCCLAIAACSP